jgi:hypothetical protein
MYVLAVCLAENFSVWSKETVPKPRGSGKSVIGSRYQRIAEDTADWEDLSVYCSEL